MTSARRTMGVEDDEDATTTGRGARSSTLSLVAMSAMAMLASGAATVGVRRVIDARGVGTGGRGTSLAALGQRMDAVWTEADVLDNATNTAAADHGFVSFEKQRDFESRPWSWDETVTCDGTEVTDVDFDFDAVEPGLVKLWRNSSFGFNYWRTPSSRHFQIYDTMMIRNAYCKAGQYQLNIVCSMDSHDSCEFAREHYMLGALKYPQPKERHLGSGLFFCDKRTVDRMHFKLMSMCGARANIEFNRISNLAAASREAKNKFGWEFSHIWYVDPEDFELGLIHNRLFDPAMAAAFEDKMRLQCYKDGDALRANNCQDGVAVEPRRVFNTRIFGGSPGAVGEMHRLLTYFVPEFVPLMGRISDWSFDNGLLRRWNWFRPYGCACPSDEELLTQYAHSRNKGFTKHLAFENQVTAGVATPLAHEYGSCNWVDFDGDMGKLLE